MLTIRGAQMSAIGEGLEHGFDEHLLEHAQRYFPDVSQALGDDLGATVRMCIRRGQAYGFTTQRDLCKYLNLAFTFGRDFDRDPRCEWASELLTGRLPGRVKMTRLYAAAILHEHEARGFFALIGFQDA